MTRRDEILCRDIIGAMRQLLIAIRRANNEDLYVRVGITSDGAALDVWRTHDGNTVCVDTDRATCIHQGPI